MTTTVPAWPVADMLNELYDAGWTIDMVSSHGGPSPAQQWRITSGKTERTWRSTAIAVADLYESLEHRNERLPAEPLTSRIRFHHDGELASVLEESDRRQFYRVEEQGWIDVFNADRWCMKYLGLHLLELYPQ